MNNELQNTPENIANPQRRSMLKAAAWAAPVVAIAATAPLAAASVTLTSSGGFSFIYDVAAGNVTLLRSTFGINASGTPGREIATGALSVTVDYPAPYLTTLQAGDNVGKGWIVQSNSSQALILVFPAGLSTKIAGNYVAPSFDPILFQAPVNTMPAKRSFAFEDSWANFPEWGTAATWPK